MEKNTHDPCKLFYQLKFTDKLIDKQCTFIYQDKAYRFFDYFDEIVTRTGRHIPIGTIFSDTIKFSNHMQNHEFNHYLYHYLLPNVFQKPVAQKMAFEEVV